MSRSNAKTKATLTAQELFLVRHYVREGATEDRLGRAARRARISEKWARTLLKRPHVQAELALQKQILRHEQAKLDAADIHRKEEEEDVLCRDTERKAMHKLNTLIDADPRKLKDVHRIQMQVLKLALVVSGTIRDGRTERLAPPDGSTGGSGQTTTHVPGSFFERGMMGAADAAPLFGSAEASPVNEKKSEELKKASEKVNELKGVPPVQTEPLDTPEPLEVKVGRALNK